ncbi:MAG: trimethylamine methyltransferase family protein [Geminicoccaceae bacterium]
MVESDVVVPPRSGRRGSGGRAERQQRRATAENQTPAYIKRNIPYPSLLDEEALERIEARADRILAEIGIEFRDDPEALSIWRKAGVQVDGTRVRFEPGQARALCKTAPSQFTQVARNPARSVVIGGPHAVFAPVYGPPFVRCLEKGRRYGALEDFENLVKLAYSLPSLHHTGFTICEPCDVAVNKRHLDMMYAHMRYSDKPFLGAITAQDRAEDCVAMARILFGSEIMDENCVIMAMANTNSPLVVDKVVTEAVRTYSAAGQGMIITPFILMGAMSPVTVAAAVAQALAETLAVCAFTQLVRPGAPFVMGSFLSTISLKSGAPTFGTPESSLATYALGQIARRLGVPVRFGGSFTTSKVADAQAGYESAEAMHATAMSGANFVLHSAGWLEGGLVTGFEKLVMDADRLGAYQVLLSGVSSDENGLGADALDEVGPGGHFLGCGHTMANYQTAFYETRLSDSDSVEKWEEAGSLDMAARALARWRNLLANYQAPTLDPAIDEELRAYVERRKGSMTDAWY